VHPHFHLDVMHAVAVGGDLQLHQARASVLCQIPAKVPSPIDHLSLPVAARPCQIPCFALASQVTASVTCPTGSVAGRTLISMS
jgi:hypothetical protein